MVRRLETFQSSWMKYSWKRARSWISDCCTSIEKFCTWPSRKLASGVPVLATPGRSLPSALNVNDPVGDGGWITFSRSQRQSSPIFIVWRPLIHVSVSATSETLVLKLVALFGGDPSCWYPLMRNVGSVLENRAVAGIPGMLGSAPVALEITAAVRATVRRVSPIRSSFSRLAENER